jgi:hypothetical protein
MIKCFHFSPTECTIFLKSLFAQHVSDVTASIISSTTVVFHSHRFLVSGVFIPCDLYWCWATSSLYHGQFQTQTLYLYLSTVFRLFTLHHATRVCCLSFIRKATCLLMCRGDAVAQWLRHCAANRKVMGSIPDGVGFFH